MALWDSKIWSSNNLCHPVMMITKFYFWLANGLASVIWLLTVQQHSKMNIFCQAILPSLMIVIVLLKKKIHVIMKLNFGQEILLFMKCYIFPDPKIVSLGLGISCEIMCCGDFVRNWILWQTLTISNLPTFIGASFVMKTFLFLQPEWD